MYQMRRSWLLSRLSLMTQTRRGGTGVGGPQIGGRLPETSWWTGLTNR